MTLIPDEDSVTWGKAFQMNDQQASRTYLDTREVQLGGYTTIAAEFVPLDQTVAPFEVLIYIALPGNEQYLGIASYKSMANDIISSKGHAGHNLEYLAKLAQFMREHLPTVQDDHLYLLEQLCIYMLQRRNPALLHYFHYTSRSVEKKWLKRVQIEWMNNSAIPLLIKNGQLVSGHVLKKAHSLENTSSPEHSDEDSDSSDSSDSTTGPYLCPNQDGCCGLDEQLDGSLLIKNLLLDGDCLYLDGSPFRIAPRRQDDAILTKEQYRRKKNSFSGFGSHARKSIKGY